MDSEKKKTFKISDFISLMFQYFSSLDRFAEKVKSGENKIIIYYKEGIDGKYTNFDYIAQKLFILIIEKFYPDKEKFIIIGEEDINEECDKQIIENDPVSQEFLSEINKVSLDSSKKELYKIPQDNEDFNKEIDISNSVVSFFIDPIDGTRKMYKKVYYPVTSMIGVCIDKEPFIGFLHYPFIAEGKHGNLTYFNLPSKGIFKFDPENQKYEKLQLKTDDNKFEFTISETRSTSKMVEFIKTFPNNGFINNCGLGNKIIDCLNDDYIYFTTGKGTIGLWDICPTSCLLKGIDAYVYGFNGEKIKYPPEKKYLNENCVVCLNQKKLKVFLDNVKKYYSEMI